MLGETCHVNYLNLGVFSIGIFQEFISNLNRDVTDNLTILNASKSRS